MLYAFAFQGYCDNLCIIQAPFWAWWGSEMNKNSNTAKNSAQEFLSRFHGNAKGFKLPKFEMPGRHTHLLQGTHG